MDLYPAMKSALGSCDREALRVLQYVTSLATVYVMEYFFKAVVVKLHISQPIRFDLISIKAPA